MAILSVSRRTDVPTFYSDWFLKRIEDGSLMVRNPYNQHVSQIPLGKDVIDCIVFWTKNPIPMLDKLERLDDYPYYFQYTLTGYGKDMEAHLPSKNRLVAAFKELHDRGNGHVIWRYDPIVFTGQYTPDWHLQTFERIARELNGYTDKCVISFVDMHTNVQKHMRGTINYTLSREALTDFCKKLSAIAAENGMKVGTCAEVVDLDECGIEHNKCIDPDYIERIIGAPIDVSKDKGQRKECGCVESVEVGSYNTCGNGCKYCYACKDMEQTRENIRSYDPDSPMLCDELKPGDKVTVRNLKSVKAEEAQEEFEQLSLFDDTPSYSKPKRSRGDSERE